MILGAGRRPGRADPVARRVRNRLFGTGSANRRLSALRTDRTGPQSSRTVRLYPFNGITTTCDALWMGVPTVTWSGRTSVSRSTKSILVSGGLGHLAADTPEEFVRIAVSLVNDPQALRDQRRAMRQSLRSTALLEHERFTRGLESAYRRMWETWATHRARVGFEV